MVAARYDPRNAVRGLVRVPGDRNKRRRVDA